MHCKCFSPDCSELADHVVHRAKVRLKKRQRRNQPSLKTNSAHGLQATVCSPSSNPSKQKITATLRPLPNTENTGSQCQSKVKAQTALFSKKTDVLRSTTISSLGQQLEMMEGVNSSSSSPLMTTRSLKVVYWSDRQSVTPKDTGIPNVPPVTPSTCKYIILHARVQYNMLMSGLQSYLQNSSTFSMFQVCSINVRRKKSASIKK